MSPFFLFIVYDLLTGKLVRKIRGHTGCVRDVSWHPLDYNLITSSVSKIIQSRKRAILYTSNEKEVIITKSYFFSRNSYLQEKKRMLWIL